jgi:hypothetical protein
VTAGEPRAESSEAPVARPETDDYDLLTYGEVAARLAEVLSDERQRLEGLRSAPDSDPAAVRALEQRVQILVANAARYEQQGHTNDVFERRFGRDIADAPKFDW